MNEPFGRPPPFGLRLTYCLFDMNEPIGRPAQFCLRLAHCLFDMNEPFGRPASFGLRVISRYRSPIRLLRAWRAVVWVSSFMIMLALFPILTVGRWTCWNCWFLVFRHNALPHIYAYRWISL